MRGGRICLRAALCAAGVAMVAAASAPAYGDDTRVVSIVRVEAPWWAPAFLIRNRFAASIPRYEQVSGLLRKFFILSEDRRLGGIYLWENRAAADAFYDEAWHADIVDRYGEPADLLIFESPTQLIAEAGRAAGGASETGRDYVALLVRSGDPAGRGPHEVGATREASVPGLLYRYAGAYAQVYLFANERHAEAFVAARSRPSAGSLRIERFDAPVVLHNAPAAPRVAPGVALR